MAERAPRAVSIDPMASVGPGVVLASPARIEAGAVLRGPLEAGSGLKVEARALVGGPAQHRSGDLGRLVLGRDVHLHEACTLHRGSPVGTGCTRLGDGVRVMAYAHVGHDVVLEDGVTLANGAQLGGHAHIEADATIGARAALHQFVRVGRGAMVAAGAFVSGDVLPWCIAGGDRATIRGVNRVALRRRGAAEAVPQVSRLLRLLSPGGVSVDEARQAAEERYGALRPEAEDLLRFAGLERRRSLCPRGRR